MTKYDTFPEIGLKRSSATLTRYIFKNPQVLSLTIGNDFSSFVKKLNANNSCLCGLIIHTYRYVKRSN